MKYLFVILLFAAPALAQTAPPADALFWVGDATAKQYQVLVSVDKGATWTAGPVVPQPAPFPADKIVWTALAKPANTPADGMVLYKACTQFVTGTNVCRENAGAWKNYNVSYPTRVGVE